MVIDLLIKNIKLLQHNRLVEGCISVENGRIYYIGKETHQPSADIIIDGQGYVALPGAVDIHVHFRDPGRVHKEDFTTGSMAAVAGGVTTVIDMPNTIPHTNTLSRYKEKKEIGEKKAIVDFSLHAGVSEDEKKLQELLQSNIPSIKVYMPKLDDPLSTLRYIYSLIVENNLNTKVVIHAEDPQIIAQEKAKLEQRKAKRDLLYHYLMRTP
ncbi:MAG: dihydroorotase, partial [Candidatus Asgardarchaeum californiense]